jgi:hypothetical protein
MLKSPFNSLVLQVHQDSLVLQVQEVEDSLVLQVHQDSLVLQDKKSKIV